MTSTPRVHTRHGTFTEPPHVLLTTDGHVPDYTSHTQLRLLGDAGVPLAPPGHFEQIRVTDTSFDAVLLQGVPVKVPLDHVREVQVVENDFTDAALLCLGILAGVVLTPVAVKEANASSSASADAVVHPESHLLKEPGLSARNATSDGSCRFLALLSRSYR